MSTDKLKLHKRCWLSVVSNTVWSSVNGRYEL